MELWDKTVIDNLRGSAYLQTWIELPYYLKQMIAESMYQVFKPVDPNCPHNNQEIIDWGTNICKDCKVLINTLNQ